MTIPKPLFLADLAYYGIENVDASKIVYHFGAASPCLADIEEELSTKMIDEIQACIATVQLLSWQRREPHST